MTVETGTILRVLAEHPGYHVHDWADGYGEPGYSSEGPVVLGDWWCRRQDCGYPDRYDNGKREVHGLEWHYPRVFAALEDAGCELVWDDEWVIPDGTNAAYRTTADSYQWQPTAVFNSDTCEYMVPEDGHDVWLEWAENDPSRCLMERSVSDADMTAAGYVEHECGLENGWHPGQDADPVKIADAIRREAGDDDVDIIFQLSETSQFYIGFCVWVRYPADLIDGGE